MAFFNNARDLTIHGGSFNVVGRSRIDRVVKVANVRAMHNSSARYDPPKCHPGTRMAIREYIIRWIFGVIDKDALILWLYGPAGSGKSAILQTIAEDFAALNILLASFFFSRSDETRNHPGSLVATIAYQIRYRIPQIATMLDAAIERDPMIFDKTLDAQIEALILNPLRGLVQCGFFSYISPRLIIIDALDECNDERHRRTVLRAIARAIREHRLPFIFLVSSRPETDIRMYFNSDMAGLWNSLVLDDNYRTESDIRLFLKDSFRSIKTNHPMKHHIPPMWPEYSVINTLVRKSSGQFIFPSTVIKYISVIQASPQWQLEVILGVRPARPGDTPFAEIDALYMHILSSVKDTQLMLDILALLMGYFDLTRVHDPPPGVDQTKFVYKNARSARIISWYLDVELVHIDLVLSSLVSITHRNSDSSVHISHASLSDFLSDQKRSGDFYIDQIHYSEKLVHQAIKRIRLQKVVDLNLFCTVFGLNSYHHLKMTDEFFEDLASLPLDLIWDALEKGERKYGWRDGSKDVYWLYMLDWLNYKLPKKSEDNNIDPRYQELCIKYATHLKWLFNFDFNQHREKKIFGLLEIPQNNTMLQHSSYTKILRDVFYDNENFKEVHQWKNHPKRYNFNIVMAIIRYSNLGQNQYIHSIFQILRALDRSPHIYSFSPALLDPAYHGSGYQHSRAFLTSADHQQILESRSRRWYHQLNSGKIYRKQREIRLLKFRKKKCYYQFLPGPEDYYDWNRPLISTLLIPFLDRCPYSNEVSVLLKQCMKKVHLDYSLHRRLRNTMDRYMRRRPDVGNN